MKNLLMWTASVALAATHTIVTDATAPTRSPGDPIATEELDGGTPAPTPPKPDPPPIPKPPVPKPPVPKPLPIPKPAPPPPPPPVHVMST